MVKYVKDYTALISGFSWWDGAKAPRPVFLTYSFETKPYEYLKADGHSAAFINSFKPFTSLEKAAAKKALAQWDNASGIVFLEVPAGQGDVRFGNYRLSLDNAGDAAAYANYPLTQISASYSYSIASGGDVSVDHDTMTYNADDLEHVLVHEIGHAIGLKHPFDDSIRLDKSLDNTKYTVMSYSGYDPDLGRLDIDAVRALYGKNRAPDDSWSWNSKSATLTQEGTGGADTLRGVASKDVMRGFGGTDLLFGSGGDDRIEGGTGNDKLFGGDGDDILIGGSGNDVLNGDDGYVRPGDGNDTAYYGTSTKTVTVSLVGFYDEATRGYINAKGADSGRDTFTSIENVRGGRGDDVITGDNDANILSGGAGSDRISGGGGADWLYGETGRDSLTGGSGADRFVFDERLGVANYKTIEDFEVGRDKILLDIDVFAGLPRTGVLSEWSLRTGNAARDGTDHVIYDKGTGRLYFDADGVGGKSQVVFAKVDAGLTLHGSDFLVIA